uniref:Uncharacterized protein n=1 Tax=Anguilla anguilla TaxID=7936 RepID=A0A0E9V512_ANGAN
MKDTITWNSFNISTVDFV